MKTLNKTILSALLSVAASSTAFAFNGSVDQDLKVEALAPKCEFSDPITGRTIYVESDNAFKHLSAPSIQLTWRGMKNLYISNDLNITKDGEVLEAQIENVDYMDQLGYGVGVTSYKDGTELAFAASTDGGFDNAVVASLENTRNGETRVMIRPSLQMSDDFSPEENSTYKTSYTLTCVQ